jgi:alkylhydroperoxidase family enzyme
MTTHERAAGDVGSLQSLREVGLTLEDAWDVAEIAAMYNFTNRMADGGRAGGGSCESPRYARVF